MSTSNNSSTSRNSREAGEKTISEKLARKRSLDRKAQQAARSRTKWTIENLEYQVAQLNNVLANETARLNSLLHAANDELVGLRVDNAALRSQLDAALQNPAEADDEVSSHAITVSPPWNSESDHIIPQTILAESTYETVPWNTEPTCPSDGILQSYASEARMLVHATSDIFLKQQPDFTNLLAQQRSQNPLGVSSVVSDILLAYKEINTLPKKAACLYVMYKFLNWLIYRTKLTYDQMPMWLRPVSLQIRVKHGAWIDRIPWPSARIYLINHPEITFDTFARYYSSTFHLSWPYDDAYVLVNPPQTSPAPESAFENWFGPNNCMPGGESLPSISPVLNPVFEQHLRELKNWSVSETFKEKFPELATAIERDSLHNFDDQYARTES